MMPHGNHKDYAVISLRTNVDSLLAQQNLSVNGRFQSDTIQQLTSGYRINSSADDAAGLSVANALRNRIAGLSQGVLNANQGVSQLQIIDGGLSNISLILDRMQTLATESASQTFAGNRETVQGEYSSLLAEIDRQANNIGLGDNNAANASRLQVYIGGGQDSHANSTVSVNLENQSVSSTGLGLAGTSVLSTSPVTLGTSAAKVIQAGNSDTFTVYTTSGKHVFTVFGETGDTVQSQVDDLNSQLQTVGITADLNSSGVLQIQSSNAFSVSAKASTANDLVPTAGVEVENTGLHVDQYTGVSAGNVLTIAVGSVTTTGITMTAGTRQDNANLINQALQAAGITSVFAVADATADVISLQGSTPFTTTFAPGAEDFNGGAVAAQSTPPASAGGDPDTAINAITQAVQTLGTVQGIVGAGENTLNYAISLAQSQISSFSAAQSQIRDANVAAEAADLTKAQVVQQASIAAMVQANQEPRAMLSLLRP